MAEVAFAAAIVGLVLGLLGIAGGGGWCALVGIAALLQLQGTLSGPDLDEFSARAGYLLMLGLFAWAGVLHLVRWWKRRPVRPPRSLGHRAALAAVVIVLIPVSIYAGVMAGGLWITPLFWAAGLYIYRLSTLTPAELEPPPG